MFPVQGFTPMLKQHFSASRLRNGEERTVNKTLVLTRPLSHFTQPEEYIPSLPIPSRAEDDRTRTDVLFPPGQALINNLQNLIFDPFTVENRDPKYTSPLFPDRSILSFTLPCTY